jgi:hypothetical protein
MIELDTRLIQYDLTTAAERPALLAKLFDSSEELDLVQQFLSDPFARPLLEFMLLGAIPFEDFVLLRSHGYAEVYRDFASYVPAARGLCFPDPQLTEKARSYRIIETTDREAEVLIEGLVLAYRAKNTGQGIVAGRAALEDWLDKGDEGALSCVVDPETGGRLDAWGPELENYDALIDPLERDQIVARRANQEVALPLPHSPTIHDTGHFQINRQHEIY